MTHPPLSADLQAFLHQETTTSFLAVVRQFIQLLENRHLSNADFFSQVHSSLSQLYATGFRLEAIALNYSGPESEFNRDDLFDDQNNHQITALGPACFYREVFDPA